jgi:hypothetical protein
MKKIITLSALSCLVTIAAQAQWYNDGPSTNSGGLVSDRTLQGINTANGTYSTAGSTGGFNSGVFGHFGQSGTGVNAAFINNGSYDASVNGKDYFYGPGSAAGQQEIAGSVMPVFAELSLQNGTTSQFDITNSNGIRVTSVLGLANGITTTVRSNTSTGAIKLDDNAAYGTVSGFPLDDTRHVNGYVSKTGNDPFPFPIGSGTDLRVLSISAPASATDQYAVAWMAGNPSTNGDPSNGNAMHPVTQFGSNINYVETAGQWDWIPVSGTGAGLTVKVSLPAGITAQPANLRLVGWNGSQWVDLSGGPTATSNSQDSLLTGTMIAGIQAVAVGSFNADLTPTLDIDDLSFSPTSTTRDFVVNVYEINGKAASNPISIRLGKLSAFTITYPTASSTSNVFGGTPNENGNWTFTENAGFITATAKAGVTIPANGSAVLGFSIVRKPGIPDGTTQNLTSTVIGQSGGELKTDNNASVTSFTATGN